MTQQKISGIDFLNAHKIRENIYITGMFYSGITIYNQQIRTLNLIYFLTKPERKNGENKLIKNVVIIGGGISGLTAALGLRKLGSRVSILEEKSLLLHMQHGSSTRKIHPNLYEWPKPNSLKPFTELPFANWLSDEAANIEKILIREFYSVKDENSSKLKEFCNVAIEEIKEKESLIELSYCNQGGKTEKKKIKYDLLLLATGFGLEKFVGRKEQTKSYWRNEDFSQLRFSGQINKFFVSGVGDGGISDCCRLALIAFDPLEWALKFKDIRLNNKTLRSELEKVRAKAEKTENYLLSKDFEKIYDLFKSELSDLLLKNKRNDIKKLVLNGSDDFKNNLRIEKASFLNAWLIFLLEKEQIIIYHKGGFPNECGSFLFTNSEDDEFNVIVRHGTDKALKNTLFANFSKRKISELEGKQKQKGYNFFSIQPHWELEHWQKNQKPNKTVFKKTFVSKKLNEFCSVYLKTIEGIISNFALQECKIKVDFRVTLHRLVEDSKSFLFQQISNYSGSNSVNDAGRAFPIKQGMVGLAMRSNSAFYFVKEGNTDNKNALIAKLFDYGKIFARPLKSKTNSFLLIPLPCENKKGSVLCLYLDCDNDALIKNEDFRKLLYWSLSSFIKKLESVNANEVKLTKSLVDLSQKKRDNYLLRNTHGLTILRTELKKWNMQNLLKIKTNHLIDIYDKE